MRPVAEEHAIGRGKSQRVTGGLFPSEVLRPLHELAVLHARELRKGSVRRLVAPDALRRREHRIAAIALFVVTVVLIAMDNDFVADLPARNLRSNRPNYAGRIRTGDVKGVLVTVDRRDRSP